MQYKYEFIGGLNNSFVFETVNKIVYEINLNLQLTLTYLIKMFQNIFLNL
jgi:hypothetical protein